MPPHADYIKAGPLNREGIQEFITEHYPLTGTEAEILVNRSLTRATGMGSWDLPDGTRLWVSALCTMPGLFMLEAE